MISTISIACYHLHRKMDESTYNYLERRIGPKPLKARINRQKKHASLQFTGGFKFFWENNDWIPPTLHFLLKKSGLLKRAIRNTLEYEIVEQPAVFENLPQSFQNYRILQITDLHIDGMFDHGLHMNQLLKTLDFDLCVLTGDFRYLTYGPITESLIYTKRMVEAIGKKSDIIGILGNHDYIEMLPALENMGIKMLMNESHIITKGSSTIGIAGVDDPHFYNASQPEKAIQNISSCPVKILLAHSQECIEEAEQVGFDYFLCGHTHGGQICLPGGRAIITNTSFGGPFIKGPWHFNRMLGYTSRGVGTSLLPVRFNCPPEITIHVLKSS